jgi:hypothetical protein
MENHGRKFKHLVATVTFCQNFTFDFASCETAPVMSLCGWLGIFHVTMATKVTKVAVVVYYCCSMLTILECADELHYNFSGKFVQWGGGGGKAR